MTDGSDGSGYASVADRVAQILKAAEEAAAEIRATARREAEAESSRRIQELTREAEAVRTDADNYAQEVHAAVDSYAGQRRREAEDESRGLLAEAEAQARAIRETAQAMAKQIEGAAHQRGAGLREEVRVLEERRQRALEGLRDIAFAVHDVLVDAQGQTGGEERRAEVLQAEPAR